MIQKLKNQADFKKVAQGGQPFFAQDISLKVCKNNLKNNRFGVVVSLQIDKRAVVRNKIRRQISEIIKSIEKDLKQGYDILILTREDVKKLDFDQMQAKLIKLFQKADLI